VDKETQRLKVQLLEAQQSFYRQSIELATMKLEKLDAMLRQERMILMGLEREDHGNGIAGAVPTLQAANAPTSA
jgi:catechol-2,3-dioxygenase